MGSARAWRSRLAAPTRPRTTSATRRQSKHERAPKAQPLACGPRVARPTPPKQPANQNWPRHQRLASPPAPHSPPRPTLSAPIRPRLSKPAPSPTISHMTCHKPAEMGNLAVCNRKLIGTITLPITSGNWHYSRSRVIGNVVDSITETPKKQLQLLFIMTYKKYKFVHNTKYCFKKLLILIEFMIS